MTVRPRLATLKLVRSLAFAMAVIAVPLAPQPFAQQLVQGSNSVMAAGDIRAVDQDAGQLTIDHGPLLNLNIPPAVRVFQVRDRDLLNDLKIGDSILFLAENIAGQLTVVRIQTGPGDPHGDH